MCGAFPTVDCHGEEGKARRGHGLLVPSCCSDRNHDELTERRVYLGSWLEDTVHDGRGGPGGRSPRLPVTWHPPARSGWPHGTTDKKWLVTWYPQTGSDWSHGIHRQEAEVSAGAQLIFLLLIQSRTWRMESWRQHSGCVFLSQLNLSGNVLTNTPRGIYPG